MERPVIPTLSRLKEEDPEFEISEASPSYIGDPVSKLIN